MILSELYIVESVKPGLSKLTPDRYKYDGAWYDQPYLSTETPVIKDSSQFDLRDENGNIVFSVTDYQEAVSIIKKMSEYYRNNLKRSRVNPSQKKPSYNKFNPNKPEPKEIKQKSIDKITVKPMIPMKPSSVVSNEPYYPSGSVPAELDLSVEDFAPGIETKEEQNMYDDIMSRYSDDELDRNFDKCHRLALTRIAKEFKKSTVEKPAVIQKPAVPNIRPASKDEPVDKKSIKEKPSEKKDIKPLYDKNELSDEEDLIFSNLDDALHSITKKNITNISQIKDRYEQAFNEAFEELAMEFDINTEDMIVFQRNVHQVNKQINSRTAKEIDLMYRNAVHNAYRELCKIHSAE